MAEETKLRKKIYFLYIILSIFVTSLQSQTTTDTISVLDTIENSNQPSSSDSTIFNNFNSAYYFNSSDLGQNIKQPDITKADYLSFSDLLKTVPGYFISDYGSPGMYNPLFYHGLPSTNTSVFLDGIPFGNNFFGSFEQCLIMMGDIEKIEIVSPGQSIAYGNINVINIVTNKKNSPKPITYIRHSEAPYNTYLTDFLIQNCGY